MSLVRRLKSEFDLDPPKWLPQEGPQEQFFNCEASICVYGGAASGGKTYSILMEPLKHIDNPGFTCQIFRRTYAQIVKPGAIWDESMLLYPLVGGAVNLSEMTWRFPSGAKIAFGHYQHEKNIDDLRGAQIALIEPDQLEQFTERQFWSFVERNRSTCGVVPYIRASCNPLPGTWLANMLSWWIDQESGFPIESRSGAVRWFVRANDRIFWADHPQDLTREFVGCRPKSLTFIASKITDNKILMERDPNNLANLMSLPRVERMRQLEGNWKVSYEDGLFEVSRFKIVPSSPRVAARVRYWDKAATKGGGAYSCGVLIAKGQDGLYRVEDRVRGQWSAAEREAIILQTAQLDRRRGRVVIWTEQEPGSGGKESAEATVRNLAGFEVHSERVTGDKVSRAMPYSAQVEAGNVLIVEGDWNKEFLDEHAAFPAGDRKDQVDAAAGAFNKVAPMSADPPRINVGAGSSVLDAMPKDTFR